MREDEKDDYSWAIPGPEYPLQTAKYKKWKIRELHLFEAVDIARKTLEYCIMEPESAKVNEIYLYDLFSLFAKVLELTSKSVCFPKYKRLLKVGEETNEKWRR